MLIGCSEETLAVINGSQVSDKKLCNLPSTVVLLAQKQNWFIPLSQLPQEKYTISCIWEVQF